MNNLVQYWSTEGIKQKPSWKSFIIIASFLTILAFIFGRTSLIVISKPPQPLVKNIENLPEISLSENSGSNQEKIEALKPAETTKKGIQVVSGNLIGIYDSALIPTTNPESSSEAKTSQPSQQKLTGIRILGEIKNTTDKPIKSTTPLVRFYDTNRKLLNTKIAAFTQSYQFMTLRPEETSVYDIVVTNPPQSEYIVLEMATKETDFTDDNIANLQVKDKTLEPTTINRGTEALEYYKFSAKLTNTENSDISQPAITVWIKNDKNKVIGITQKTFPDDVLTKDKTLDVQLLLVPALTEKKFSFDTYTVANKLK